MFFVISWKIYYHEHNTGKIYLFLKNFLFLSCLFIAICTCVYMLLKDGGIDEKQA